MISIVRLLSVYRLRWVAMAPDANGEANLRLPTTFQLRDPEAYFLQVVEPRVQRAHERVAWDLTWKHLTPAKRSSQALGRGGAEFPAADPSVSPTDAPPSPRGGRKRRRPEA